MSYYGPDVVCGEILLYVLLAPFYIGYYVINELRKTDEQLQFEQAERLARKRLREETDTKMNAYIAEELERLKKGEDPQ